VLGRLMLNGAAHQLNPAGRHVPDMTNGFEVLTAGEKLHVRVTGRLTKAEYEVFCALGQPTNSPVREDPSAS